MQITIGTEQQPVVEGAGPDAATPASPMDRQTASVASSEQSGSDARNEAAVSDTRAAHAASPGGEADHQYALPRLRDQFLAALEGQDTSLKRRIAEELKGCCNPLPGMTCQELGLPPRSTYGQAARQVLGETMLD